jgi:MmyB-like transcription regulator ligand binding domain
VLKGHEPFPALAVDRHWQLVSANANVAPLLAGVDEALLKPPVTVLRLSLHPSGLAPRIANLTEWRAHLLMRLRTQIGQTADAVLIVGDSALRANSLKVTRSPRHRYLARWIRSS